jgi:hypothetical protein
MTDWIDVTALGDGCLSQLSDKGARHSLAGDFAGAFWMPGLPRPGDGAAPITPRATAQAQRPADQGARAASVSAHSYSIPT